MPTVSKNDTQFEDDDYQTPSIQITVDREFLLAIQEHMVWGHEGLQCMLESQGKHATQLHTIIQKQLDKMQECIHQLKDLTQTTNE